MIHHRFLGLLSVALICSCASKPVQPAAVHNPMLDIWAGIRSHISDLAKTGRMSRWMEATEECFPISSSADLEKALNYIGDEDSEQKNLERKTALMNRLKNSDSCYWFGFECDYSIIVFFDAIGNQTYCYPEEYAAKNGHAEQVGASNGG